MQTNMGTNITQFHTYIGILVNPIQNFYNFITKFLWRNRIQLKKTRNQRFWSKNQLLATSLFFDFVFTFPKIHHKGKSSPLTQWKGNRVEKKDQESSSPAAVVSWVLISRVGIFHQKEIKYTRQIFDGWYICTAKFTPWIHFIYTRVYISIV